jgi:hypothetical protein
MHSRLNTCASIKQYMSNGDVTMLRFFKLVRHHYVMYHLWLHGEEFHIASVNWDHFASGIVRITVKCGPIETHFQREVVPPI